VQHLSEKEGDRGLQTPRMPASTLMLMGETFGEIDDDLRAFIGAQRMFFVATAPHDAEYERLRPLFPAQPDARTIVAVSCSVWRRLAVSVYRYCASSAIDRNCPIGRTVKADRVFATINGRRIRRVSTAFQQ
jgi:hypothetical protein